MRLETRTLYALRLAHNGLGAPRARPPERSPAAANRPLEQVCDSRKWAQFRESQASGDRGAPRATAKGVRGGEAPRILSVERCDPSAERFDLLPDLCLLLPIVFVEVGLRRELQVGL